MGGALLHEGRIPPVKPDGSKLLISWYDRRESTDNSQIDLFAAWAAVPENGAVNFNGLPNLKVTTASFPPGYVGTQIYAIDPFQSSGPYDPVYPPQGLNLNWRYFSTWTNSPPEVEATSFHLIRLLGMARSTGLPPWIWMLR